MTAQVYDPQDKSGDNNTWNYNRAPEGYKFELVELAASITQRDSFHTGLVAIYDGHEYTHWNQFPGVESRELLGRDEFNSTVPNAYIALHNWECKEYTLGVRSLTESYGFKICIIVWYYLKKMSTLETLYYAVIQPKWKRFKKAFRTTLDPLDE